MKTFRALLAVLLVAAAAQVVCAAGLIPTPDFAGHPIPTAQHPDPVARLPWRDWLDVGALAGGIALASYFALRRRTRRGLFLLAVVSLAWLGFWRKGCTCPIGAIQNVTLALFDRFYVVPAAAVVMFVLPLVATLFFGRTFCAAVCPLGAIQELIAVRPVRVPNWLDHALGLLAYVYLGAAVLFAASGSAFVICRYDPFVGLFRLSAGLDMLILSGVMLVLGIFVGRPYCRYLCPYGAILGWLSHLSRWHVRIPPEECIQCRLCEESCPYGAIRQPTVTPPVAKLRSGRRLLVVAILLLPTLVALGAVLGRRLEAPLASVHPTVQLAERVWLESRGQVEGSTEASEAFRNSGRPSAALYAEARNLSHRIGLAGGGLGAWVGLVLGLKLIHLAIRRRRTGYQPERSRCVACGRCFWYCPCEQARHGWIQGIV
ncbi:MAG: 4Fe-4S binding protein [Thermoguttaceae bacterium]|jgi:Fe-S-cluster-containing hydrogenase component 2